jgi:hypothetical protein
LGEKESNESTLQKHQQQMRDELNRKLADCQEYRAVVSKLQEKLKEQEGESRTGVCWSGQPLNGRAAAGRNCKATVLRMLVSSHAQVRSRRCCCLHAVAAVLAQQEKEAATARLQAVERDKGAIAQQLQEALQGQAAAEAGLQAVQLEVQVAKAGLQEADERVAAMRSAAAAANTDFNGKLAAKSAQLQELQGDNSKLSEQLADAQSAKAQAEAHAGDDCTPLLCAALHLAPASAPKATCCL